MLLHGARALPQFPTQFVVTLLLQRRRVHYRRRRRRGYYVAEKNMRHLETPYRRRRRSGREHISAHQAVQWRFIAACVCVKTVARAARYLSKGEERGEI